MIGGCFTNWAKLMLTLMILCLSGVPDSWVFTGISCDEDGSWLDEWVKSVPPQVLLLMFSMFSLKFHIGHPVCRLTVKGLREGNCSPVFTVSMCLCVCVWCTVVRMSGSVHSEPLCQPLQFPVAAMLVQQCSVDSDSNQSDWQMFAVPWWWNGAK